MKTRIRIGMKTMLHKYWFILCNSRTLSLAEVEPQMLCEYCTYCTVDTIHCTLYNVQYASTANSILSCSDQVFGLNGEKKSYNGKFRKALECCIAQIQKIHASHKAPRQLHSQMYPDITPRTEAPRQFHAQGYLDSSTHRGIQIAPRIGISRQLHAQGYPDSSTHRGIQIAPRTEVSRAPRTELSRQLHAQRYPDSSTRRGIQIAPRTLVSRQLCTQRYPDSSTHRCIQISQRTEFIQGYRNRGSVSAVSAGAYTTILYVMGDRMKWEGVHPPASQGWADFSIMIEYTLESGHCHSVFTLWLHGCGGLYPFLALIMQFIIHKGVIAILFFTPSPSMMCILPILQTSEVKNCFHSIDHR